MKRLLLAALATTMFSCPVQAQWQIPDHAIAIGRGSGTGFKSALCTSAQLIVGQAAADPICRTVTGDVTISSAGATAIGATKVTFAMLNSDVLAALGSASGPASATDNAIARFDGTTGKLLQNSIVTINDLGHFSINSDSTFFGKNAGAVNNTPAPTDGIYNTFVGANSGLVNTSGYAQSFFGYNSGVSNTIGDGNTYLGYATGSLGTSAKWNVAVGVDALFSNILGANNTVVGHHAGVNLVFGAAAGENTIVGAEAGKNGVGGISNSLFGYRSGYNLNASGTLNTYSGHLSGFAATSATKGALYGVEAGQALTTGNNNTFLGYRSGFTATNGNGNVFLGHNSGFYETLGNKLFIDNQDRTNEATARTNALIYGVFDPTPANQTLALNGVVSLPQGIKGTATNNNATALNVGEYIESVIAAGSPVTLTNNTTANITSISLTAGDWDVNAAGVFAPAATTSQTFVITSISLTTATLDTTNGRSVQIPTAAFVAGSVSTNQSLAPVRFSLSGTTTVFLVMRAGFTVSTAGGYGMIRARRVR